MTREDMAKVQRFVESLGYKDVSVEDGGVMDFGRISIVTVMVKREA